MIQLAVVLIGAALGAALFSDLNPPVLGLVAVGALVAGEVLAVLALYDALRRPDPGQLDKPADDSPPGRHHADRG